VTIKRLVLRREGLSCSRLERKIKTRGRLFGFFFFLQRGKGEVLKMAERGEDRGSVYEG
jgi:hypothetical protein